MSKESYVKRKHRKATEAAVNKVLHKRRDGMSKEVKDLIEATNEYVELLETYKDCSENPSFTAGMLIAKTCDELSPARDKWIIKKTIVEMKGL